MISISKWISPPMSPVNISVRSVSPIRRRSAQSTPRVGFGDVLAGLASLPSACRLIELTDRAPRVRCGLGGGAGIGRRRRSAQDCENAIPGRPRRRLSQPKPVELIGWLGVANRMFGSDIPRACAIRRLSDDIASLQLDDQRGDHGRQSGPADGGGIANRSASMPGPVTSPPGRQRVPRGFRGSPPTLRWRNRS